MTSSVSRSPPTTSTPCNSSAIRASRRDGRASPSSSPWPIEERNDYRSRIWLVPTDGSAPPRPLTGGAGKDTAHAGRPMGGALLSSPTATPTAAARRRARAEDEAAGLGPRSGRGRSAPGHRAETGRGRSGLVARTARSSPSPRRPAAPTTSRHDSRQIGRRASERTRRPCPRDHHPQVQVRWPRLPRRQAPPSLRRRRCPHRARPPAAARQLTDGLIRTTASRRGRPMARSSPSSPTASRTRM